MINPLPYLGLTLALAGTSQAALWVDFNSTNQGGGPNNNAGWEAYSAAHENIADLGDGTNPGVTMNYNTTFALTGAATVGLTPDWTNTTDRRVRQSIDRGAGNDANWVDTDLDLVTDWLGSDSRPGNGGNGNWDGVTGTPTYLTLTLSGLAAGTYHWASFHQDTEHMHTDFGVWLDTGAGFTQLADGTMTDSTPGGNPDSGNLVDTFAGMAANGSIYNTSISANGTDDVVLRFAPYSNTAVHRQFFGIDGFQLTQVPEPSSGLLGLLGAVMFLRRRR
jgi:hypothetical protein